MKKEKDICKDCAEYGSEFCPECLDDLYHTDQHDKNKESNTSDLTDTSNGND